MKKIMFVLSALVLVLNLSAQTPAQTSSQTAAKLPAGAQPTKGIGRIYGKIVDSSGKGVRDASIIILQARFDTAT